MCLALSLSSEHTSLWQTQRARWLIGWINSVQCVASDGQMALTQVMFKYILCKSCSSRKYPYFPHSSGNSNKASHISLNFLDYKIPHPAGNSSPFCRGSMDIFLMCTLQLALQKSYNYKRGLIQSCHST